MTDVPAQYRHRNQWTGSGRPVSNPNKPDRGRSAFHRGGEHQCNARGRAGGRRCWRGDLRRQVFARDIAGGRDGIGEAGRSRGLQCRRFCSRARNRAPGSVRNAIRRGTSGRRVRVWRKAGSAASNSQLVLMRWSGCPQLVATWRGIPARGYQAFDRLVVIHARASAATPGHDRRAQVRAASSARAARPLASSVSGRARSEPIADHDAGMKTVPRASAIAA